MVLIIFGLTCCLTNMIIILYIILWLCIIAVVLRFNYVAHRKEKRQLSEKNGSSPEASEGKNNVTEI